MTSVAVLGTGRMGGAMAGRLAASGFDVFARRGSTILHHQLCPLSGLLQLVTCLSMAKFLSKVIEETVPWNYVLIAISLDDVLHRLGCLLILFGVVHRLVS